MSAETIAIGSRETSGRPWTEVLHEWVTTVDHKRLGILYIVYSLLFLVVQWASSAYSPRLHLFRDHPLVWHSFGFFAGTIVYCIAGGLALGGETQVSLAVPAGALFLILIALALFRSLQATALGSIQLAPTLETIASRGRLVLDALYSTEYGERGADDGADLPPVIAEVYWKAPPRVLQQVDLPKLVRLTERAGAVVVLVKRVSEQLVERGLVARVRGNTPGLSEARYWALSRWVRSGPLTRIHCLPSACSPTSRCGRSHQP